jgi:NADH-quinone oxidoreductase subunit L
VGAFSAAIFHLMTHSFFKALLFLGAGSVIHAMGGEQDLRKMGGLWEKIPTTAKTMMAGTLAIAGIFPLAGFFSKDEILWRTFEHSKSLWLVGFITAGMTAFYMFRLVNMTFFGKSRVDHEVEHHIHESPPSITVVLIILAVLSIIGGWIGIPAALGGSNHFEEFLEPVIAKHSGEVAEAAGAAAHHDPTEYVLMAASLGVAALGIWLAYVICLKREGLSDRMAASWSGVHNLLYRKYYVDEIYDALVVRPIYWMSNMVLWHAVDERAIDGSVNGLARAARSVGERARMAQSGNTRSYATWVVLGAVAVTSILIWLVR